MGNSLHFQRGAGAEILRGNTGDGIPGVQGYALGGHQGRLGLHSPLIFGIYFKYYYICVPFE
ncbi:MAG: hypothetical protein CRN43_09315 [Candidatus Nephrothrix sp. EaCA]|nr:MAG: hypothetical protein CRN43_09315 [Candidatus Nephrothrix sp. EaCA]